ncbi:hypothetical protein QQP08_020176 [Theobroma cacao]|nr:hypothetical protein QQP08_020176 [Theobroma cacao]
MDRLKADDGMMVFINYSPLCVSDRRSGPAAHTVAIYTASAELKPILFEGWMANDVAPWRSADHHNRPRELPWISGRQHGHGAYGLAPLSNEKIYRMVHLLDELSPFFSWKK